MSQWFWMKAIGAVACIIAAALLAWRKTPGWGWFLFIAFCCLTTSGPS